MLRGNLEQAGSLMISGWAQNPSRPEDAVSLIITINDQFIQRVLANGFREDLQDAAIGSGRHAFRYLLPNSLSPTERHVIRVFDQNDGLDIPGSPVTLEPSAALGEAEKQYLAKLLGKMEEADEITLALGFLVAELDKLKQRQANHQSRRAERDLALARHRQPNLTEVGPNAGQAATARLLRRALVIDNRVPDVNRNAESHAVLSHLQSLQRLGYEVVFAPAEQFDEQRPDLSALNAIDVACCRPPLYGSVEEVMDRQARSFDVVYLRRVSTASKYLALARKYFPKARIIYSVADLHHIRLARQAVLKKRPELIEWSKRVQLQELMAAASADVVITHSTFEADVRRKEVRGVNVHVVPWLVQVRPTSVPFANRKGFAFIGSFDHRPDGVAARLLIGQIMPLVRQRAPEIECLLVGNHIPEWLTNLCGNGVVAIRHVDNLAEVFDRVRLTVAPLAYRAGVMGKMLESMAAGIPCVCTPVAAEGLELPEVLRGCVATSAPDMAAIIQKVHGQKKLNEACKAAGLDFISSHFAADLVDQSLGNAIGPLR